MNLSRACFPLLAALSACVILALPARADTLAGDSLQVSLVCFSNPDCSGYTQSSPLIQALGTVTVPNTGDSSVLNFTSNSSFSQTVTGSFEANATQYIMTLSDPAGGGLVGIWVDIPVAGGNDHVPILDVNPATTDSFPLSSADYFISESQIPLSDLNASDAPVDSFNFAGLPDSGTAVIDLGSPSLITPEPAPAMLLITGLFGLLGLTALRRRKAA